MKDINMTEGKITPSLIRFLLPLVAANLLQVCYNTADSLVLSWFAGNIAYSSVGVTTTVVGFLVNFFISMAAGANLIIARYLGAGQDKRLSDAIHTAALFSVLTGIGILVVGQLLTLPLLRLTDCPGELLPGAELYMRIIFLGTPASVFYNFTSPILRAKGDTKRPLIYLAVSGAVNVGLNLLFVCGFGMTVDGVAIATIVSQYLSAGMLLVRLLRLRDNCRLYITRLRIRAQELGRILRYGLPSAIAASTFSISNIQIQSAINSFGTVGAAGNAASIGVENFVNAIYNTLGVAAVAFLGQNLGAGNRERVFRLIRTFFLFGLVIAAAITVPALLFGKQLLYIYLPDNQAAIDFGIIRMYCVVGAAAIGIANNILGGCLQAFGKNSLHMITTIVGICGFRLLWMAIVYPGHQTPLSLYLCYPITWCLVCITETVCLLWILRRYRRGEDYLL